MSLIVRRTNITESFALEQHPMWAVHPTDDGPQVQVATVAGSETFGRYLCIPPGRDLDQFFGIMETNHPTTVFHHDLTVCEATAQQIAGKKAKENQIHTFNLSLATLSFKGAAEKIISILSRYGRPNLFTIEITEPRGPISDERFQRIAGNVKKIAESGYSLLLDDFAAHDPRLKHLATFVRGFKTDKIITAKILKGDPVFCKDGSDFIRQIQDRRDGIVIFEGVSCGSSAIALHERFSRSAKVLNQGHDLVPNRRSGPRSANNSEFAALTAAL